MWQAPCFISIVIWLGADTTCTQICSLVALKLGIRFRRNWITSVAVPKSRFSAASSCRTWADKCIPAVFWSAFEQQTRE